MMWQGCFEVEATMDSMVTRAVDDPAFDVLLPFRTRSAHTAVQMATITLSSQEFDLRKRWRIRSIRQSSNISFMNVLVWSSRRRGHQNASSHYSVLLLYQKQRLELEIPGDACRPHICHRFSRSGREGGYDRTQWREKKGKTHYLIRTKGQILKIMNLHKCLRLEGINTTAAIRCSSSIKNYSIWIIFRN